MLILQEVFCLHRGKQRGTEGKMPQGGIQKTGRGFTSRNSHAVGGGFGGQSALRMWQHPLFSLPEAPPVRKDKLANGQMNPEPHTWLGWNPRCQAALSFLVLAEFGMRQSNILPCQPSFYQTPLPLCDPHCGSEDHLGDRAWLGWCMFSSLSGCEVGASYLLSLDLFFFLRL